MGHFAGQLGDGAAVSLGEIVLPSGQKVELNLKGSGRTPFTRPDVGIGRKNLCQMIQELLVAEALAAMGVPTSRCVAVVAGEASHSTSPPLGVLLRVTGTFMRIGSFE